MSSVIPITLKGDNLGKRHQYLNSLVNDAFSEGVSFDAIKNLPESSPVDRLFKIDLASKYKISEYVLENLKHEDMLYVSRALKCLWLLDPEYSHIVNPIHMEREIFPEMLTTAVNKTHNWIQLHLRDERRLQEFYQFYYDNKDFDKAIKYIRHCSKEFILNQIENLLELLTPHSLKIMCEICPEVAKCFFNSLENNKVLLTTYLKKEKEYFFSFKFLLKANTDVYLDIIEKYFNQRLFKHLSPKATRYIIRHNKNRFLNKPELYTVWLLEKNTLAENLDSDEIKELLLKLARAEYLKSWFSYKNIEPLMKRLNIEERTLMKNQIFVEKNIGEKSLNWPYPTPSAPKISNEKTHVYDDVDIRPNRDGPMISGKKRVIKKRILKRKTGKETLLNQLFNQYRFLSFKRTLMELQKRMAAESNAMNREYMMLVLVSKSGGHSKNITELLNLLTGRHMNEPSTLRGAVIRSLVRRAAAWRLPSDVWIMFRKFSHGLGLDGTPAQTNCNEGLHAVVIRDVLNNVTSDTSVLAAFFNNYSSFAEYTLSPSERRQICNSLPAMLLAAIKTEPADAYDRLTQLLDTLDAYKLRVDKYPEVVTAITCFARRDSNSAAKLLLRLFGARVARRELIRENFALIQNEASYLNALKHDIELLTVTNYYEQLLENQNQTYMDRYLRKLLIYFYEENGLAMQHLAVMQRLIEESPHTRLARPIAHLIGSNLWPLIVSLDSKDAPRPQRQLVAALKTNAHLSRPSLDLNEVGWQLASLVFLYNRVTICSTVNLKKNIENLLSNRKTAKIAAVLAMRKELKTNLPEILRSIGELRPEAAVCAVLRNFHKLKEECDPKIWAVVKTFLERINFTSNRYEKLQIDLVNNDIVPETVKLDYWVDLYNIFRKVTLGRSVKILHRLIDLIFELNDEFVVNVIKEFLFKVTEDKGDDYYYFKNYASLCVQMSAKYLLLSVSEEELEQKIEKVGEPILLHIENQFNVDCLDLHLIDEFIFSMKFTKAFMDYNYIYCTVLFERVIKLMRKIMSIEIWLEKYVNVHLSMIYCKSVRQGIKRRPEIFTNEITKLDEGVKIIGFIFGKYIAHEVSEMHKTYFTSILHLYKELLSKFLEKYFYKDKSWYRLLSFIIRGIMEYGGDDVQLIAEYIFNSRYSFFSEDDREVILKLLLKSQDKNVQFFLFADFEENCYCSPS